MNDNLCRICLCNGASIPIFDTIRDEFKDVSRSLSLCFYEKIEDIPGYPRNICETCYMSVNDIIAFQNKFKQTCELLKQTCLGSSKAIKQEHEYLEYMDSPGDDGDGDLGLIKSEYQISFSDAKQFEELVKPLIKKEPRTRKQPVVEPSTKKNNNKISKKLRNKNYSHMNKTVKRKLLNSRISSSILEGEFVFTGEKWCIRTANKTKANQNSTEKNVKEPKVVARCEDKSEGIKKTQKDITGPEPRLCELCGSTFTTAEKLKRHKDVHHSEKTKMKCPQCPKSLSDKYGLQRHIKRCHFEKPKLICADCGKGYVYNHELNHHYKTAHLKQRRRIPCKLCDRKFAAAKSLLVHERAVHTGERPEVCSVCGATFTHTDYLNEHMRLHTGETPYKCPVCGRGYAQRCNMRSHVKYNHRISQLDEALLKTIKPGILKLMKP